MWTIEVIEGPLQPDGSLRLDGKPALPADRVRVTLEAVSEREDVWLVLDRIRGRRQAARGDRSRTRLRPFSHEQSTLGKLPGFDR